MRFVLLLIVVSLLVSLSIVEASHQYEDQENFRFKRMANWEYTFEAIKCSLKIVAKEVASKFSTSFLLD